MSFDLLHLFKYSTGDEEPEDLQSKHEKKIIPGL